MCVTWNHNYKNCRLIIIGVFGNKILDYGNEANDNKAKQINKN